MSEENKKIKILIIDNDEMMRIYFRDIFWIHGRSKEYYIETASSLEEAEIIIYDKATRPDTVFFDINAISKKNSISIIEINHCVEFVSKIKNDKNDPIIKVILYSSHKEDALISNLSKIGIDGFLVKGENTPKEIIAYTDKIHGTRFNN